MKIAIIDYGMGNLRSIQKACEFLGFNSCITSKKEDLQNYDKIILPGVGAFKDAINLLQQTGLDQAIKSNVLQGKYLLGICLGHQLLFDVSFEDGRYEGLGLIKGEIIKFDNPNYKIPHIGWNSLEIKDDLIFKDVQDNSMVYFVHSYYASCSQNFVIAYSDYCGHKFTAAVREKNILGMQFHPEKSGEVGLKILKNFGEL
ncbi:MAG TPA: imidazole glycerol phosphate synthase subunit HisH [Clostridia bacterium]